MAEFIRLFDNEKRNEHFIKLYIQIKNTSVFLRITMWICLRRDPTPTK